MLGRTEGTRAYYLWYDYNIYDDGVIPLLPIVLPSVSLGKPQSKYVIPLLALFLYQSGPTDFGDLSFHNKRSARKYTCR